MSDLIAVLEKLVPSFFKGAFDHFKSLPEDRAHLRYTNKKIDPSHQTLEKVKADPIYKMEREFYDFAVAEFDSLWQKIRKEDGDSFLEKQFHYEKIKPENL